MENEKFIYKCVNCNAEYNKTDVKYLCSKCEAKNSTNLPPKGVLKVIYNYKNIAKKYGDNIFTKLKINKFIDLLPIKNTKSLPKLKVGNTPIYKIDELDSSNLPFNLFFKDDSQNPTFSFKDRASAIVSAYAKENNINTIIAASTGNAGSSLAGICASQKQKAIILVPESAPIGKLTQIIMYGAKLIPVKGNYDDAFDLSIKATEKFGWYNRNTAYNPLTIEGKKTVSFEIFEQMSNKISDNIFVPVGDGVIISGVYKGFEDLLNLGVIKKMPQIIAVKSENSDNLIRNLNKKDFEIKKSNTIADSISVDIPRNFYMIQDFITKYNGKTITVSDNDILKASQKLSENTGLFAEPAAATAFAGLLSFMKNKKIENKSNNVVLLTGSGLKDVASIKNMLKMPNPINPRIEEI